MYILFISPGRNNKDDESRTHHTQNIPTEVINMQSVVVAMEPEGIQLLNYLSIQASQSMAGPKQ